MNLRAKARKWIGPYLLDSPAEEIRRIVEDIQPDLVHAMRIPFEGMVTARANFSQPLVISVWGNDFTLHAAATPGMQRRTRETLQRCDALHADCRRDLVLAREWGWRDGAPEVVLPGSGGIRPDIFYPRPETEQLSPTLSRALESLSGKKLVVNPRGFRGYVRNDTFFRSIPIILASEPDVSFLCPVMAGEPQAGMWVEKLGIENAVVLLPRLSPDEMAQLFSRALVAVSPSEHDGTPNTLLESMACGAFPVAGDLDSIREWIVDNNNGLLIDPSDPEQLAEAVLRALQDSEFRTRAVAKNHAEVTASAGQPDVLRRATTFYEQVISQSHVE
jgi:glycosyltransferase involved in cell wall biosynthesis